jgi:hypothetical protein
MPEPATNEATRVLASTIAAEVATLGIEQIHLVLLGRKTGQRCVVLVTTTDRATDALLEFLDLQHELGITRQESTELERLGSLEDNRG